MPVVAPGCGLPVANTSHQLTISTARVTQLELKRAVRLVTGLPMGVEADLTVATAWACLTADASDEFFGKQPTLEGAVSFAKIVPRWHS